MRDASLNTQNDPLGPLVVRCPAKLNLTLAVAPPLEVTNKNADPRHAIVSWMVATDFADTLELAVLEKVADASRFDIAFADDAPLRQPVDWPLDRDLAFRAHAAVEQHLRRTVPVDVKLTKRIAAGAGLGGGSADAAGVLSALGQALGDELPFDAQLALARALGSDVAFALHALHGSPSAVATGFGDDLQPVPCTTPLHAALVLPPFSCPTAAVYAAFDRQHRDPSNAVSRFNATADESALKLARSTADLALATLFNDLTDAACDAEPKLRGLLDTLRAADLPAHVTGSGSAVFLPARDADHANATAEHAKRATGFPAIAATLGM